jgi:hypothetical protein
MLLQVQVTHGVVSHLADISSFVEKRQREKTAGKRMNDEEC